MHPARAPRAIEMCAAITLAHRRVVGREARKYVDTVIRFSWLSRKKRQNHTYHYSEHLFVCQEKMRNFFRFSFVYRLESGVRSVRIRAENFIKISLLVLEKTCVICYNNLDNDKEAERGLTMAMKNAIIQSVSQSVSQSVERNPAWRFCQYPFCKNCKYFFRCGAPV